MASVRSLSNKRSRPKKVKSKKAPFLNGNSFKKGVCVKVFTMSPKKPNSAKRSVAKVRILSSNKYVYALLPGGKNNLQELSVVLLKGARVKDLPGVKCKAVRGCLDFLGASSRITSRSKLGCSFPKKND